MNEIKEIKETIYICTFVCILFLMLALAPHILLFSFIICYFAFIAYGHAILNQKPKQK